MHTLPCEEANPGASVGRLGLSEHPRVVLIIEADAPAIAEMPRLVASTGELTDRQAHGRRHTTRHRKQLTHGPIAFVKLGPYQTTAPTHRAGLYRALALARSAASAITRRRCEFGPKDSPMSLTWVNDRSSEPAAPHERRKWF